MRFQFRVLFVVLFSVFGLSTAYASEITCYEDQCDLKNIDSLVGSYSAKVQTDNVSFPGLPKEFKLKHSKHTFEDVISTPFGDFGIDQKNELDAVHNYNIFKGSDLLPGFVPKDPNDPYYGCSIGYTEKEYLYAVDDNETADGRSRIVLMRKINVACDWLTGAVDPDIVGDTRYEAFTLVVTNSGDLRVSRYVKGDGYFWYGQKRKQHFQTDGEWLKLDSVLYERK